MSSLKERIEAKSRRTVTLPIAVGNVTATAAAVAAANQALEEHLSRALLPATSTEETVQFEQSTAELRAALDAATEAAGDAVALVELQSLPDDEWDALFGGIEPDADGEVPLDDCRAAMLAACAVDPDLQDEAWWEEQLARPEWTKGDKLAADRALLRLNLSTPDGSLGKG